MSIYTIALAAFLYSLTAFDCGSRRDWCHCILWASYAVGNVAMVVYEIGKRA